MGNNGTNKNSDIDVFYFVGCTASFDINVKEVGINTINILNEAGIRTGILGKNEKCCGSVLLRIGQYDEFERLATSNLKTFNALGIDTLITSCAGCYRTLKADYEKVGKFNFRVMHTVEYLEELIENGKISLKHEVPLKVTFHDPCHSGRHIGSYDAPRNVLRKIPGLEFVEMDRIKENSRCCGAGGGLKAGFGDIQNLMAQKRVKDAEKTGASRLVSTCPFCYQGLQIGVNAIKSHVKVSDITEIVALAMGLEAQSEEKAT
ncbi:MAG: hypothetical protein HF978_13420 [Desulfobacteraceae bacterium]|nr:hypothetical protein [Desulfobacteraceae bacterium]MBC2756542.1 hypothetical protein [Desulfobacteraceae bacterium]